MELLLTDGRVDDERRRGGHTYTRGPLLVFVWARETYSKVQSERELF